MAMPSARVLICAEMILTPCAASVPAISEKSPGWSWVTTTRSEEPRSLMVKELGGERRCLQTRHQAEMVGHALHARARKVAVGNHRQVRLHRCRLTSSFTASCRRVAAARGGACDAPARQVREGARVQLVQDARLPAREHAGAHRAHVRVGEQVEHAQALRVAHGGREVRHGLGVVDVATLSDVRHREVVSDEEFRRRRRRRAAARCAR